MGSFPNEIRRRATRGCCASSRESSGQIGPRAGGPAREFPKSASRFSQSVPGKSVQSEPQASCLCGQRASSLRESAFAGRMPARRTAWKAVFRLSGHALTPATGTNYRISMSNATPRRRSFGSSRFLCSDGSNFAMTAKAERGGILLPATACTREQRFSSSSPTAHRCRRGELYRRAESGGRLRRR